MSGQAKKKWTKSVNREKREWANYLQPEVADEIMKAVPKSKLITPAKVADRYKITLTVAKKVLDQLVKDGKMDEIYRSSSLRVYGKKE